MTYQETLDYIFHKLPMFSRTGAAAYKADLTNTVRLCAALGNPQHAFKSIHVGGTNGKGSVSHMLASVLQANEYRTGLYTSPHLYDFRERIKIDGVMVSESFVIDFIESIKPLIEEIEPSFFEITVAMAFHYFALQKVDIAVIEVGLGGRLDSTNVVLPEVAVITNIGWDHSNLLGDTLEKIASEKAGIIKEGIPIVIGERQEGLDRLFANVAGEKGAPIQFASDAFITTKYWWTAGEFHVTVRDFISNEEETYELDLGGIYQVKNICTVLQTLQVLQSKYKLNPSLTKRALAHTKSITGLHGRWELLADAPQVVLDAAHNEPGVRELILQLEASHFAQLHLVIGVVKDKDVSTLLGLLPRNATYYFTQASIPRALPAEALAEAAGREGLKGSVWPNVNAALTAAWKEAGTNDLILVCGSIFLLAEVDREQVKSLASPAS